MGCVQSAEAAVRAGVQSGGGAALPGMIFNQSKKVTYTDAVTGRERSVYAGRMECTMQVCWQLHLRNPLLQPLKPGAAGWGEMRCR